MKVVHVERAKAQRGMIVITLLTNVLEPPAPRITIAQLEFAVAAAVEAAVQRKRDAIVEALKQKVIADEKRAILNANLNRARLEQQMGLD